MKISWAGRVKNEEVLPYSQGGRNILHTEKEGRVTRLFHIMY